MPTTVTQTTEATLAMRLDAAMRATATTNRGLAARVGVDPRQIARWRRGYVTPGASYIVLMAKALGVSTDWLLGR